MIVEGIGFGDMARVKENQRLISNQLHDIHESIEKTNDLLRQQLTVLLYIKDLLERD